MTNPVTRQPTTYGPLTSGQHPPATGVEIVYQHVIDDIHVRVAHGQRQYGTPLMTHNGRDALQDLYEELLDALLYLKQLMLERDRT